MTILKNIRLELILFITLCLFAYSSPKIDIFLFDFFLETNLNFKNDNLKNFFVNITELGNSLWYFVIIFFFIILFLFNKKINLFNIKKQESIIYSLCLAFSMLLISGILTQILKHLFGRPRPNYTDFENGFSFNFFALDSNFHSFPSGHSSTIFMVCFILASFLPRLKYYFYFLASIIAFSRVVVGAHFFTDIIGGAILSLIVFKTLNLLLSKFFEKKIISEVYFGETKHVFYSLFFLISLVLFVTVGPTIDIYIASLFYKGYSQFFLQSYDILSFVFRDVFLPGILIYLLFLPIISKYTRTGLLFFKHKFSLHEIFLIWTSQILTILIIVNLVLKNFWGRARPGDIYDFGGDSIFTPWYKISSYCDSNCSFVSGDASVGFSLIILYFITKNNFYVYLSVVSGLTLGAIRIFAGGHFLSDILLAGVIVIILNAILFRVFKKYYE